MYKVFIYDKPVVIHKKAQKKGSYEQLSSAADIDKIFDLLKQEFVDGIEISCQDPTREWNVFQQHFKNILAAGGLVLNQKNELLVIYRLGKWDLPKGKLEEGEDIKSCALREVEEECHVFDLKIIKEMPSSYHCYMTRKGKWMLKRTHWFLMESSEKSTLIPQKDEGIESVDWFDKNQMKAFEQNTYQSILEVLGYLESA